MSYKQIIVKKPWGYEYLAYENEHVALWFLYISHGQRTSMHCHPNKTTGLVILDGSAEVSFLRDTFKVSPIDKMMIRKGLFHSTQATGESGVAVFEIETPVDKHDLVRLQDSYGREGKPYEDSTFEAPKPGDCLWIEDPSANCTNIYNIANCIISISNVSDISFIENYQSDKIIMFLRGGLLTDYNINVAGAGDVVEVKVLKELSQVFKKVSPDTVIMTMERSDEQ